VLLGWRQSLARNPAGDPRGEKFARETLGTDVQAAMTVLGPRDTSQDPSGIRLDLVLTDLRQANLIGAHLQDANLVGADLGGAALRAANLRGADLSRASLQSAELSTASVQGARLSHANLEDATLDGADLQRATLGPGKPPRRRAVHGKEGVAGSSPALFSCDADIADLLTTPRVAKALGLSPNRLQLAGFRLLRGAQAPAASWAAGNV